MRDALVQAQYPALRRLINPGDLLPQLRNDPSLVEEWVAYSEDKRTSGGFYILRTGEVGEVANQRSRKAYPSIEEAVAEFVLQELDYWQSLGPTKHQPARHYLRIYRIRLAMAEDGTTEPKPEFVTFMRDLIARLEPLDPGTPIQLDTAGGIVRFKNATTGECLAQTSLFADI